MYPTRSFRFATCQYTLPPDGWNSATTDPGNPSRFEYTSDWPRSRVVAITVIKGDDVVKRKGVAVAAATVEGPPAAAMALVSCSCAKATAGRIVSARLVAL